jgi:hypothetical protein
MEAFMETKLQIPDIGDKITLSKDWEFDLYKEYRNASLLLVATGKKYEQCYGVSTNKSVKYTIPKGTVLVVNRVYIRNGAKDFSSITFKIEYSPNKTLNKKRFWSKLIDVNNIYYNDINVNKVYSLEYGSLSIYKINRDASMCGLGIYDKNYSRPPVDYRNNVKDIITILKDGENIPIYNVNLKFELKDSDRLWNKKKMKVISGITYTLKSLSNEVLYITSSYESLKKEAKALYLKTI